MSMAEPLEWPSPAAGVLKRWFVLVTLTGLERVAKMHLDEAGLETFLPLAETHPKSKPRGRVLERPHIVVPRFPGYLFGHLMAADPLWYSVREARGVLHALTSEGGRPIPLPAVQINRWLDMADKDGIVEHWRAPPERQRWFDQGSMIEVECGSHVGKFGIVERQDRGNVTVIMADKRYTIRWDQIRAVG